MNNHNKKNIPSIDNDIPYSVIPQNAVKHFGLGSDESHPYIVLKYLKTNFECFSDWTPQELKQFSSFINKLHSSNWVDISRSSGFGMTIFKRKKLPEEIIKLSHVSQDIPFFELRITQKARVHGFRLHSAFFLVLLDRNHRVCSQ